MIQKFKDEIIESKNKRKEKYKIMEKRINAIFVVSEDQERAEELKEEIELEAQIKEIGEFKKIRDE